MKILIVDDEPSIVNLIKLNLKLEGYDTVCAYTGREAIGIYAAEAPDIVLLDIMLPDMDGYDVLRAIQEIDHSAAVIFITANDKRTSKILGLELGADDYITKPFHMRALILKVRNIIASREKLKDLYGQRLSLENLGVEISGGDDKFLQQLNEAIDRDIADPALNLDTLCRRIGLSRASLYRKLMSATGLSPARYIQSVRLNLAARMLRETQMSVSEIATASGFNSLIHFSASFRKQYGVPPSRYAAGQEATGPEAAPGRENEPQE